MIIKRYTQFVNESSDYKYGCVMIETPFDNWSEITSIIDEEDLYNEPGDNTYGIQNNPHLTLLYGLHKEVKPEMVKSALNEFNGIKLNIKGIGVFENENFDVVKLNVDPTGSIKIMNEKLSEFPHTTDYPVYEPHITIAYVKKGLGKKYLNNKKLKIRNRNMLFYRVCYSMTNGEKIYFNLNEFDYDFVYHCFSDLLEDDKCKIQQKKFSTMDYAVIECEDITILGEYGNITGYEGKKLTDNIRKVTHNVTDDLCISIDDYVDVINESNDISDREVYIYNELLRGFEKLRYEYPNYNYMFVKKGGNNESTLSLEIYPEH